MLKIKENLEILGLNGSYLGYHYIAYMLNLMMNTDDPVTMKALYIETAKRYHINVKCVEKDVRTASKVIWERCLKSGFIIFSTMNKRPSNAKLLYELSTYMKNVFETKEQV